MTGGSNSSTGFETCTECIGFESLTEKDIVHSSLITDQLYSYSYSPPPARRSRDQETTKQVFPPFLTSLCENGRPRFSLVKTIRDNGRLEIAAVPNRGPELLVVRDWEQGGGHVRIRSLDVQF